MNRTKYPYQVRSAGAQVILQRGLAAGNTPPASMRREKSDTVDVWVRSSPGWPVKYHRS